MADPEFLGPGWTVTEAQKRPSRTISKRPRKSSTSSLLQHAGAANLKAAPTSGEMSGSGPSTSKPADGGYADFKARFLKEYRQQERVESMSICRRQRKVFETLQANQEIWEPRLAKAAKAEAEDFFRLMRTASEQQARCAHLSQLRVRPSLPVEEEAPEMDGAVRSWAEQQAKASELAEPRVRPMEEIRRNPEVRRTSAVEQQRHMAHLARPKLPKTDWMEDLGTSKGCSLWKDELLSRAAALVPEEVQAARSLLEKMRCRPRSAKRSEAPATQATSPEVEEQVEQLKSAVEEVLWVALLQVRSCPKPGGAALEERLGSLLISKIGPSLRPVARRLLAPGHSLPRRLRAEFPRLARHLCFRDSEDSEVPVTSWQNEDLVLHLNQVRQLRDDLLGMDFTKDAVARLIDAAG